MTRHILTALVGHAEGLQPGERGSTKSATTRSHSARATSARICHLSRTGSGPGRCPRDAVRAPRAPRWPRSPRQQDALDLARRLVDDAGDDHGGLILDLWHMARGCGDLPGIRALPARYIFAIELSDADSVVHSTLLEDTLDHRRLCGEGDQDVPGFIRAVTATGYRGPWGVEILSADFRRLPLHEHATRSHQTTISQFPA